MPVCCGCLHVGQGPCALTRVPLSRRVCKSAAQCLSCPAHTCSRVRRTQHVFMLAVCLVFECKFICVPTCYALCCCLPLDGQYNSKVQLRGRLNGQDPHTWIAHWKHSRGRQQCSRRLACCLSTRTSSANRNACQGLHALSARRCCQSRGRNDCIMQM